jgi:hypothetical protein
MPDAAVAISARPRDAGVKSEIDIPLGDPVTDIGGLPAISGDGKTIALPIRSSHVLFVKPGDADGDDLDQPEKIGERLVAGAYRALPAGDVPRTQAPRSSTRPACRSRSPRART